MCPLPLSLPNLLESSTNSKHKKTIDSPLFFPYDWEIEGYASTFKSSEFIFKEDKRDNMYLLGKKLTI